MHENEGKSPVENPPEFLDWRNLQANYSAMMTILAEKQALIGTLLGELGRTGALSDAQMAKITDVYGNAPVLDPIYDDLYKRFANYFVRVKQILENPELYQPETPFPEPTNKEPENSDEPRNDRDDRKDPK